MAGKNFTPIYTAKELAERLTAHDGRHPDHGIDCQCDNGLISTLRTYFTPPVQLVMRTIRPYVPPEIKREQWKTLTEDNARKPWMAQRDDESPDQYDWRISHSCYNCGRTMADRTELDLHEDVCGSQGKQRP